MLSARAVVSAESSFCMPLISARSPSCWCLYCLIAMASTPSFPHHLDVLSPAPSYDSTVPWTLSKIWNLNIKIGVSAGASSTWLALVFHIAPGAHTGQPVCWIGMPFCSICKLWQLVESGRRYAAKTVSRCIRSQSADRRIDSKWCAT